MVRTELVPRDPRRTLGIAALTGLGHALLAGVLWDWFGFTTRLTGNEGLLIYTTIGAVLVGAVPAVLLHAKRLRAPSILVVVSFVVAVAGTFSTVIDRGLAPVGPTPFGWYLLGWVGVLVAALLVGGIEYGATARHSHAD